MEGKVTITSAFLLLTVLLATGTIVYQYLEKWSVVDSLYFSTSTLTTIGYGDLHPTSEGSRLFTVFYIIGGVSLGLFSMTALAKYFFESSSNTYSNTSKMIEQKVNRKFRKHYL